MPRDRRVWLEALTLAQAGYRVSVICPQEHMRKRHERLDGISIYRYPLPSLPGIGGHLLEYAMALTMTFILTCVVLFREGFDVIHAANGEKAREASCGRACHRRQAIRTRSTDGRCAPAT